MREQPTGAMDGPRPYFKGIFIDKDGVLVDNSCYPKPPRSEILPEAIEGIKLLSKSEFKIFIISNQSWIGKGMLSVQEVESIFEDLSITFSSFGVSMTGWYYCPHKKEDLCKCRKPSHQLLLDAAKEHDIDLSESYCIGDMTSDILAGKRAGTTTILVQTGQAGSDDRCAAQPDLTFRNFTEAVRFILSTNQVHPSPQDPPCT